MSSIPTIPTYNPEQVKDAVNRLTAGRFKKFGSIIDVASFIWDVVNDMLDTFNDKNLTLQQKEDIAIGISRCVVSVLKEKNLISAELSDKTLNLINSADSFLDTLISVYKSEMTKNVLNVVCGWFGCCAKNTDKVEIPKSIKIEVIEGKVKIDEVETPKEVKIEYDIVPKSDDDMPPLEKD